jgi:hypothetical protein
VRGAVGTCAVKSYSLKHSYSTSHAAEPSPCQPQGESLPGSSTSAWMSCLDERERRRPYELYHE